MRDTLFRLPLSAFCLVGTAPGCAHVIQRSPSEPPKSSDRKGSAMARLERLNSLQRWTTALLLVIWLLFSARSLLSQESPTAAASKPAASPSAIGIPVVHALVVSEYGS